MKPKLPNILTLDAFYMDKYEVTNAQYRRFVEATGHREPKGSQYVNNSWVDGFEPWKDDAWNSPNQPVVCVSWEDAVAYCEWAGKRLPTEAEWEYAARGGLVGRKYVWGDSDTPPPGAGNFADETARKSNPGWTILEGYDDGYATTSPVGSFDANGYGLYDMAGNVWEWCSDWFGVYPSGHVSNPTGPNSSSYRVVRGGSWYSIPNALRVANRDYYAPSFTLTTYGFRCAQDLP